jgi:hypothetical protein
LRNYLNVTNQTRERATVRVQLDEWRASASASTRISEHNGDRIAVVGIDHGAANERALFDLRVIHLFPHSLHPLYQGEKKKSRKKKK